MKIIDSAADVKLSGDVLRDWKHFRQIGLPPVGYVWGTRQRPTMLFRERLGGRSGGIYVAWAAWATRRVFFTQFSERDLRKLSRRISWTVLYGTEVI